jgi:hypothetical protein
MAGSPTTVSELTSVPVRERKRKQLDGNMQATVEELVGIIRGAL